MVTTHPIGDGVALALAQVVERPHDLAGGALGAQVVVELEIERDRPAVGLGQRELVVALGAHVDVVGGEPLTGDLDGAVAGELLVERGAVGGGQCRLDLVDAGAEPGPERAEVGHDRPAHETRQRVDVLDRLHVQLGADLGLGGRGQRARPASAPAHGPAAGAPSPWRRCGPRGRARRGGGRRRSRRPGRRSWRWWLAGQSLRWTDTSPVRSV